LLGYLSQINHKILLGQIGGITMARSLTTPFSDWVNGRGTVKTALDLNVSEGTVRVWLRGQGTPHAKTINEILRLSKEEKVTLTFQNVFDEATKNLKN
jgi:hypothetical protein